MKKEETRHHDRTAVKWYTRSLFSFVAIKYLCFYLNLTHQRPHRMQHVSEQMPIRLLFPGQ